MACSGFQAASDVFVTAAHCLLGVVELPPGSQVRWSVSFDDYAFDALTGMPIAPGNLLIATGFETHPGFGHDLADRKDYGVVLFDGADKLPGPYVDLPYLGQLDDMKRDHELKGFLFDRAGYGVAAEFKQGPPRNSIPENIDGYRNETQSPYKALHTNVLRLHGNADKTGLGNGCFLDSGSPILGSSDSGHANVAFAIFIGLDEICRSDNWAQRLDTQQVQDFFGQFLSFPPAP